jgi:two-component system osmolarity sensor histidine kinase EnvZ
VHKLNGSLFLRLALLVILTVFATQIFTWWIFTTERRELIAKQVYGQVVDTLADLEGRLDSVPLSQRPAYLNTYNRPGFSQLLPPGADNGISFLPTLSSLEQILAERLSSGLGKHVTVKARWQARHRHEIWLSVQVLGQPYWLVVPMGRFRENVFSLMMLAAVLAALSAVLVASTIAWRTSKPISRVVSASHELAEGRTPLALDENSGPREVRELAQGFNRMAASLEVSARERRLMLAGLSHDLRTPLTRLKLMVEMQNDSQDKPGMLSDIDEMSGIVRQFIDFARSEEKPHSEPVSLAELASSVVSRYAREKIQIQLEISHEPEILADPLALQRLLGNLLDNARRYGAAPIEVHIAASSEHAKLSVIDHGKGIPQALHQAALAPFERLAAHRGTDGGSGLGLAIVARVVKQHGGTLDFSNVEGGGLCVTVALPLKPQDTSQVSRET